MNKLPLWEPGKESIENSIIEKFREFVNSKYGIYLRSYHDLYDWSVKYFVNFWKCIAEFGEINFSKPPDNYIRMKDTSGDAKDIRNFEFFSGAKLNFAENLLRFKDDKTALIQYSENMPVKKISYNELFELTARAAKGLKKLGVNYTDRVAGFISNNIEAVTGMLAASSIGASWTSCSPDFGLQGVLDRFSQTEPKILIAVNGYYYNGKKIRLDETINQIIEKIPAIEKIVIIDQIGEETPTGGKFISWDDLVSEEAEELEFHQFDFNHPLYIMYSSGTTGVPKCIVHGAGGTLLQHYKELALHTGLKRDDTIFYFTTCGWMMWNWLVSSLYTGATIVLFDGSPGWPDLGRLWKMAESEGVTIFGTSPKYLTTCEKAGLNPGIEYNLSKLRAVLSTGAPLTPQNFEWVYSHIKKDLQLASISGGTDIISCFMLGCPVLPVYSGEIQCRGLGMKVEAFDESGKPVTGQKGELVCTAPFPSMPVYFWNDPGREKYDSAYFEDYPGIWRHGDYIEITETGGVIVYGRSDATLNPGGVRIGTAEIYRVVESMEEIRDSIVVGYPYEDDVLAALFVVMKDGFEFDEETAEKIKKHIRSELTPRHVPKAIRQISEVPVTLNGKKTELAVLKALTGKEIKNKASLANPESLEQFRGMKIT